MKPNLSITKAHIQGEQKPIWLNSLSELSPKRFSLANTTNSPSNNDNKAQRTSILCDALLSNSKDREIRSNYKQIIHEYFQSHPEKLIKDRKRNKDAISITKEEIEEVFGQDSNEENYYMKIQLLFDFITTHSINKTKYPKKIQKVRKSEPPSGLDSQNSEDSFTLESVQNDKTTDDILQEQNGDKFSESISREHVVKTSEGLLTNKESNQETAIIQPNNQNIIEIEIKNLQNLIHQHENELLANLVAINKGSISFSLKNSEQYVSNACLQVIFSIQSIDPQCNKYTNCVYNMRQFHTNFLTNLLMLSKKGISTFRKQISDMIRNNSQQETLLIQNGSKQQVINSNSAELNRKEEASSQNCDNESLPNDLMPENQVLITKYFKIESKSAISQNDFNESITSKVVVKEGSIINSKKADEIKMESKTTLDNSNDDQNSYIKANDESTHIILKNEAEISELKTSQENEAETHQDHSKSSDYISKKEHIYSQSNENHDETKNADGTSKENDQSKLSSYYRKLKMMKQYHDNKKTKDMKNKIKFPNSTSKSIEKPNDISSGKIKECPDSYILERIKKNEPKISKSHSISQDRIKSQSLTEERKSFMNIASNYNKTHQNLTESQQKQRISLFEKESKVPVFFKKIQEIQNGNTDETVVIHGNQSISDRLTKNISESKCEAMHQEDSHFMAKDFICSHVFVPFQPK